MNHYTLNTAHNQISQRKDVGESAIALLSDWIRLNAMGDWVPLPVPELSHYSAKIFTVDDALVVTVMGPIGPHMQGQKSNAKVPLVAFGVAKDRGHGDQLWSLLSSPEQRVEFAPNIKQPETPWCSVVVYPTASMHKDSLGWLADFERCCAWAWLTCNPKI